MDLRFHLFVTAAVAYYMAISSLVDGHATPCNQNNDTLCLEGVRELFVQTDFWFGDSYDVKCPNGTVTSEFSCMNPDPSNKNIASRMLRTNNFDVNTIQQFLHIYYSAPAGSYMACGHLFEVDTFSMNTELDNTHTIYTDMWTLSHRPSITFDPTVVGELYTLVAYDAGYLTLGGIWVNIITRDTANGLELYPHTGPRNALYGHRNPFVYALFRQKGGEISNLMAMKKNIVSDIMANRGHYHLDKFIADNNLEGPIGVGYVVVKTDPFGIQHFVDRNIFNNCPYLIAKNADLVKALQVMGYQLTSDNSYSDYRGTFLTGLEYDVEVIYDSPEAHFDSCCKHTMLAPHQVTVDPHDERPILPLYTRNEPHVTLTAMEMMKKTMMTDKLYTLLMLDVTDAVNNISDPNVIVHWQIMNVPGNMVPKGDTVLDYLPPLPTKQSEVRTYVFLLLGQPNRIATKALWSYTGGDCSGMIRMRCKFNLGSFLRNLNLKIAGLSMFRSEQDAFARAVLYGSVDPQNVATSMPRFHAMPAPDVEPMMTMGQACAGVAGYDNPCPASCQH